MSEQELMGSGKGWGGQQLQAANVQLMQHIGWQMQLQAGTSFSFGSVTILGDQSMASKHKEVVADSQPNFWGQHTIIMQHLSYLLGQKNSKIHQKPLSPPSALGRYCIPSTCLLTVHTALGLPGSSETAISDTSSPCLRTLRDDRGPRPQATYNCGVSSLAKSAICMEK